jgi:hypothetical protein
MSVARATDLRCRLMEPEDRDAVFELWRAAGWGTPSSAAWMAWHRDRVHGPSIIAVATGEDGSVRGQLVLNRSQLWVRPRIVPAARAAAAVLHPDLRGGALTTTENPILQLYRCATAAAAAQGVEVSYAVTHPLWRKWLPRLCAVLPRFEVSGRECVEVSPGPRAAGGRDLAASALEGSPGEEYDELWLAARDGLALDCAVERSSVSLAARLDGSVLVEARGRARQLVGYALVRHSDGLLLDVLAVDRERLAQTLALAADWVARHASIAAVRVMTDPLVDDALQALDARPVDYAFPFICHDLSDREDNPMLGADHWYLTAGD